MNNKVRGFIGVLIVLFALLFCFSGCSDNSGFHIHVFKPKMNETEHFKECDCGEVKENEEHEFLWKKDYKHKACASCGYEIEDVVITKIKSNGDGTVELSDNLISALSKYFADFFIQPEIIGHSFEDKLNLCKNGRNPLFVKFSNECYYVATYHTASHENAEYESVMFCCYKEYTWVGFEKAEDVKENWEGKELIGAFQINHQDFCVNIKTGENDVIMEHYAFYRPEFKDGVALDPKITFDDLFIYLAKGTDKYICYSSTHGRYLPESLSLNCIEIDGKYYVKESYSYNTASLEKNYGEYYDILKSSMVSEYITNENGTKHIYGLFNIEDIAEIIR